MKTSKTKINQVNQANYNIKTSNAQLKVLRQNYEKLEKNILELTKTIDFNQNIINQDYIQTQLKNGLDWNWILNADSDYSFSNEQLQKLGVQAYGEINNQKYIQIKLIKGTGNNLIQTLNALNTLIPFLKPNFNTNDNNLQYALQSDKYILICIMEHTLSEHGFYNLLIPTNINKKYYLIKTTYNRPEIMKTFKNLEESLTYIQDRHFYSSDIQKDLEKEDDPYFEDM